VRVNLPGYEEETKPVRITTAGTSLQFPLRAIRGNLIVQTSAPAELKLNDTVLANQAPVELSLVRLIPNRSQLRIRRTRAVAHH
jgi:hypothetical protein